ncbi:helix-turn-helix domain-containing protein [Pseudoprimorskyibacter insulae]|uniref:Transcriptional activator FeaR n=1 Tax=Pseudoprimorskyibacter insulae TaxID=1695997 RepID=A0A2R8AQ38_9RHOB|nr:helix-turn-helix domain-containing protein [Pseudoprimorskyibacter insulae]SPF78171.1 Transcriptional activator FeaR [Pseudoprimorskyibacter insulae]
MGTQSFTRAGVGTTAVCAHQFDMPTWVDSCTVAPAERLAFWKDQVNRHNGVEIVCSTDDFVGRMHTRVIGELALHDIAISTPHRAIRRQPQKDLCFVSLQLAPTNCRFNGRREHEFTSGSMLIYQASDAYELDFTGESESLVIAVPKSLLSHRVSNLQTHLDEALHYDPAKVSMIANLMRGILASDPNAPQAVEDSLAEALLNLLVATLFDCRDAVSSPATFGAYAMLQRVRAYLNDNIDDPNLNPLGVAEALGITVSYLHKIFLQSQTTLMQYVLAERLERCRRDLAKLDGKDGISQVAYRWGFNDASHFSRSFRKRFGVSPREYRAEVLNRNELLSASGAARV